MSDINDLRKKIMPKFETRDEAYIYMIKNHLTLDNDELYKDCSDSLLPVFKVAKELCEHLQNDKDYFKKNGSEQEHPLTRLYHMAIVSKVVRELNENCDPEHFVHHLGTDYAEPVWWRKNGKLVKTDPIMEHKKIANFRKVTAIDYIFDDKWYHQYIGAIERDVDPSYYGKACYSVASNVINWEDMKNSDVLKIVAMSCTPGMFSIQEEQRLQKKIDEFCDEKNRQSQKQIQNCLENNSSGLKR